jgi:hypothetical protein
MTAMPFHFLLEQTVYLRNSWRADLPNRMSTQLRSQHLLPSDLALTTSSAQSILINILPPATYPISFLLSSEYAVHLFSSLQAWQLTLLETILNLLPSSEKQKQEKQACEIMSLSFRTRWPVFTKCSMNVIQLKTTPTECYLIFQNR